MPSYNGLLATRTTLGDTQSVLINPVAAVPAKFFTSGHLAFTAVGGVSGAIGIEVIGAVGGATFAIAGKSAISGAGSLPMPLYTWTGNSGTANSLGFPRPFGVEIGGVSQAATRAVSYSVSVYVCGEY